MTRSRGTRQRGVVLALVLVLALLLSVSMIGFARRAVIDTMVIANRDDAARADALVRGGVRLGTAIVVEEADLQKTEPSLAQQRSKIVQKWLELEEEGRCVEGSDHR